MLGPVMARLLKGLFSMRILESVGEGIGDGVILGDLGIGWMGKRVL